MNDEDRYKYEKQGVCDKCGKRCQYLTHKVGFWLCAACEAQELRIVK